MTGSLKHLGFRVVSLPGKGIDEVAEAAWDVALEPTTRHVVMWAGTNNVYDRDPDTRKPLKSGRPPKQMARKLVRRTAALAARFPDVKWSLIGCVQRRGAVLGVAPRHRLHWAFSRFNGFVQSELQLAGLASTVAFVDPTPFVFDCDLRDGLHLRREHRHRRRLRQAVCRFLRPE